MGPAQMAEEDSAPVPIISRIQSMENHSAPSGGENGDESSLAIVKLEPVDVDMEPSEAMKEGGRGRALQKVKTSMDSILAVLEQEEAEAVNRSMEREWTLRRDIESLKEVIREKNVALGVLDEEMAMLKDDLSQNKAEIDELQDQLSSSNDQVEDLRKAYERKERSLAVLRKEMEKEKNASLTKVAKLEGQCQANRKTIHALRKKLEDQQVESEEKVRKLDRNAQNKDKVIDKLKKELEEYKIKSNEQLKEKDEAIGNLKKQLENQNSETSKDANKYKAMMRFFKDIEETPENQEPVSSKKARLEKQPEDDQALAFIKKCAKEFEEMRSKDMGI